MFDKASRPKVYREKLKKLSAAERAVQKMKYYERSSRYDNWNANPSQEEEAAIYSGKPEDADHGQD